jgi:hypothetical protein
MAAGSRTQKQDDKWVFAPAIMLSCTVTKQHRQTYIPISDILAKEHCRNKHFFTQEKALYLEEVETEMARADRRSKSPIVDFSIGLSSGKSRKIRLVEAKFDVNDLKSLTSSNIPEKVQHSTDVMRNEGFVIDSGAIVLIKRSPIVQQQRHWLEQRLLAQGHYQVKTVDEFYRDYFKA